MKSCPSLSVFFRASLARGMKPPDANTLRVLIATDTHLGAHERDPIRKDDAFLAFEEIFNHAKRYAVDCVFLAGDVFDVNKPSRETLVRCMETLGEATRGDDAIEIEILSDQYHSPDAKEYLIDYFRTKVPDQYCEPFIIGRK